MSRKVCTYTDITKLPENPFFKEISKYPIITVSADLRKGFIGSLGLERKEEVLSFEGKLNVTEFRNITAAIDDNWTSDQSKFNQSIILSEFIRNKINGSKEEKEINWLTGCMRNLDALRSAITLVEEAEIKPDDLNASDDRNLALLVEAWKYLVDRDPSFKTHSERMESLSSKERWEDIFFSAFKENGLSKSEAIVFHGFYYITPIQEQIMKMLEKAGGVGERAIEGAEEAYRAVEKGVTTGYRKIEETVVGGDKKIEDGTDGWLSEGGHFAVLFMAWLPGESEIAARSEELVLKYNPDWSGKGWTRQPVTMPGWAEPFFALEDAVAFDVPVSFTREGWNGRIKSCRGIGASSLDAAQVAAWEQEHLAYLAGLPERFDILHYVTILNLRRK